MMFDGLASTAQGVATPMPVTFLLAQADNAAGTQTRTLLDLLMAGGVVGFVIVGLSFVGLALIIDGFVRLRRDPLLPDALADEVIDLAGKGRFEEVLSLCRTSDTLLGRTIEAGLEDGRLGLDAVREGMQQQGELEFTALRQRNGYLGLIAAVAPMLGLLGTVVGMISSFRLLGEAQGTARPDELALGISQALVTTCLGLILAVPLTFFFAFFRDRINRLSHEAGGIGDKLLRVMSVTLELRRQQQANAGNTRPAPTAHAASPPASAAPPQQQQP